MTFGEQDLVKIWERIGAKFSFTNGIASYNSWVKPLEIAEINAGFVTLKSPTRFIRDWVNANYIEQLENLFRAELENFAAISIIISATKPVEVSESHIEAIEASKTENVVKNNNNYIESLTDSKYQFTNFVTGDSNNMAYSASFMFAKGESYGANLLYVHGAVGVGKTHLLQATCNHIKENFKDKKALYLSAERFMFQFVKALREKDMLTFKESFRSTDILLIDDIQFIAGKQNIQEEFIHTFNALIENGKKIIISCDRHPSKFENLDERIKSRLSCGLIVDIQKPASNLRFDILKSKASALNVNIEDSALRFISDNITSSVRELEGALYKLMAHANLSQREITEKFITEILKDNLKANNKELSIEQIKRMVCEKYMVRIADLESDRRDRNIARPRQIAMYLAKNLTTKSLPEIGRNFGDKNHSTVIHAVKTIEKLKAENPEIESNIEELSQALAG